LFLLEQLFIYFLPLRFQKGIMEKNGIFLGLGGNEGSRWEFLNLAKGLIAECAGKISRVSSVYDSPAWGFISESHFLNQVIQIQTILEPLEILEVIHQIESELGRVRTKAQFASRTIDIDLIFYNQVVLSTPRIQVPHPRMHLRKFVLEPMTEMAPDFVHPVLNQTMFELNNKCPDLSICKVVKEI
jgi:2-amino-4-hydroxy-6-hydroxymethyldihydropteridine diphosphokinase